jgi:hypothetical protein
MTNITISNQSRKSKRKYKSENRRTRTSEYIRGGIRCHRGVRFYGQPSYMFSWKTFVKVIHICIWNSELKKNDARIRSISRQHGFLHFDFLFIIIIIIIIINYLFFLLLYFDFFFYYYLLVLLQLFLLNYYYFETICKLNSVKAS